MEDRRPKTKKCSRCGEQKARSEFGKRKDRKDGLTTHCKACQSEYDSNRAEIRRKKWREDEEYRERNKEATKRYREKNHEALRLKHQKRKRVQRKEVVEKYGGRCECCGENHWEFLAVDHVNGGGTQERNDMGTTAYYKMLRESSRLPGYRLLCHNCNSSLGMYSYCPHQASPSPTRTMPVCSTSSA